MMMGEVPPQSALDILMAELDADEVIHGESFVTAGGQRLDPALIHPSVTVENVLGPWQILARFNELESRIRRDVWSGHMADLEDLFRDDDE